MTQLESLACRVLLKDQDENEESDKESREDSEEECDFFKTVIARDKQGKEK